MRIGYELSTVTTKQNTNKRCKKKNIFNFQITFLSGKDNAFCPQIKQINTEFSRLSKFNIYLCNMISKAKLKYVHSLMQKKHRLQEHVFVAEGPKTVNDIMQGMQPRMIIATSEWLTANLIRQPKSSK